MKTTTTIKRSFALLGAILIMACSGARYANSGTAHDRTGANGATNGTGKAPSTTAHKVNY